MLSELFATQRGKKLLKQFASTVSSSDEEDEGEEDEEETEDNS